MLPLYPWRFYFVHALAGRMWSLETIARADESKRRIKEEEEIHRNETGDADAAARSRTTAAIERDAEENWLLSMVINSIGASLVLLCLASYSYKITMALGGSSSNPLIVWMFRSIREHYLEIARQLSTEGVVRKLHHKASGLVPISGIHRGVIYALEYAKSIAPGHVTAVYVDFNEEATKKLREKWPVWGKGAELVILQSPYRSLTRPLLRHVERLSRQSDKQMITVLLPEFVPAKWWHQLLHIKARYYERLTALQKGVIVTSVLIIWKNSLRAFRECETRRDGWL